MKLLLMFALALAAKPATDAPFELPTMRIEARAHALEIDIDTLTKDLLALNDRLAARRAALAACMAAARDADEATRCDVNDDERRRVVALANLRTRNGKLLSDARRR
ncbi:MAG: hypothetical protein AAGE01_10825 [Pseudomonadota bacterium]